MRCPAMPKYKIDAAVTKVLKGLARHPVPVMIFASFIFDKGFQGKGLGQTLLKDVLLKLLKMPISLISDAKDLKSMLT